MIIIITEKSLCMAICLRSCRQPFFGSFVVRICDRVHLCGWRDEEKREKRWRFRANSAGYIVCSFSQQRKYVRYFLCIYLRLISFDTEIFACVYIYIYIFIRARLLLAFRLAGQAVIYFKKKYQSLHTAVAISRHVCSGQKKYQRRHVLLTISWELRSVYRWISEIFNQNSRKRNRRAVGRAFSGWNFTAFLNSSRWIIDSTSFEIS